MANVTVVVKKECKKYFRSQYAQTSDGQEKDFLVGYYFQFFRVKKAIVYFLFYMFFSHFQT